MGSANKDPNHKTNFFKHTKCWGLRIPALCFWARCFGALLLRVFGITVLEIAVSPRIWVGIGGGGLAVISSIPVGDPHEGELIAQN